VPIPAAAGAGVNFGLSAAQALEDGIIDGFWANGMAAEIAERRGVGTVVLDIRRGDGPAACFDFTFASLAASEALIARSPDVAEAAVRAIVKTQAALRADVSLAAEVGRKLFPETQAALITTLIGRDLPYYDARIAPDTVSGMNAFARDLGLLHGDAPYESVVATQFSKAWSG
jgi:NitT/TauT family transport system substrate-binding protein